MTNTNATNFRKNMFEYLNQAVLYNDIINVNTKNGNAVVLSEEEYNGLMETLFLLSHPKTAQEILDDKDIAIEDCVKLDDIGDW